MKMVENYSLLWDSMPRSYKRERLQLLYNLGWEERRKNVALSIFGLLKLEDQMLCPYIIQTASNSGTESYWVSYISADRCSNQSTNLGKKKHCHLSPGTADANRAQQ